MSQYRLNLFIQHEHAKRLEELAAKKGVSKSSIVAAALASWLSPDAGDQREAAIAKRLARLSRQAERLERDQNIDRKSGVTGKSVSVRVDRGGRRIIKNTTKTMIKATERN